MHDEFRVRVDAEVADAQALVGALSELEHEPGTGDRGCVAVTRDGGEVFLYADTRASAEGARAAVRDAMSGLGLPGEVSLWRWHPLEERWEDADVPLPEGEEERRTELRLRSIQEAEDSREAGHPQWEVRITLPSHQHAHDFSERLRAEGVPVLRRWRHLLVGAEDEEQARELATRLRAEAPPGSELEVEGAGEEAIARVYGPAQRFAFFGGLAQ